MDKKLIIELQNGDTSYGKKIFFFGKRSRGIYTADNLLELITAKSENVEFVYFSEKCVAIEKIEISYPIEQISRIFQMTNEEYLCSRRDRNLTTIGI